VRRIYKLLGAAEWTAARAAGVFAGSAVDLADGYIHFSAADQAEETARRYFSGRRDLVLLTVDAEALGEALKWEPSRGGALFPHLYAPLKAASVIDARALDLGDDGMPVLGALEA
jgi:uncharacterized protein (DUF952 family)